MPHIIVPSDPELRTANTYTRVANTCGRETPAERTERVELVNFAHMMGQRAVSMPPRLVRTDIRPLECLELAKMLASHPTYDTMSVEVVR